MGLNMEYTNQKDFLNEKKNLLINFWGSGFCDGRTHNLFFANCLERSKNNLGSSKTWDLCTFFSSGFLNVEKDRNPNFFNWNKFDFPYCDGSFHIKEKF